MRSILYLIRQYDDTRYILVLYYVRCTKVESLMCYLSTTFSVSFNIVNCSPIIKLITIHQTKKVSLDLSFKKQKKKPETTVIL